MAPACGRSRGPARWVHYSASTCWHSPQQVRIPSGRSLWAVRHPIQGRPRSWGSWGCRVRSRWRLCGRPRPPRHARPNSSPGCWGYQWPSGRCRFWTRPADVLPYIAIRGPWSRAHGLSPAGGGAGVSALTRRPASPSSRCWAQSRWRSRCPWSSISSHQAWLAALSRSCRWTTPRSAQFAGSSRVHSCSGGSSLRVWPGWVWSSCGAVRVRDYASRSCSLYVTCSRDQTCTCAGSSFSRCRKLSSTRQAGSPKAERAPHWTRCWPPAVRIWSSGSE